jgi:hypothetical protein
LEVQSGHVTLKDWVEMQLPTMGKPGHKNDEKGQTVSYDATVLDWAWEGTRALSEPESTIDNPKYKSTHPGKRHPITFEPLTGKVAWPHLTPHFGRRVHVLPEPRGCALVGDDPPGCQRRGKRRSGPAW